MSGSLVRVYVVRFCASSIEGIVAVITITAFIRATGSVSAANLLNSIFWLTLFFAELPTGYLTDKWGGKRALGISLTLRAIGFLIFYLAGGSWILLIVGCILTGVAVTFLSGTFELQVKQIQKEAQTQELAGDSSKTVISYLHFSHYLGLCTGSLLVTLWLLKMEIQTAWLLSACLSFIALGILSFTWDSLKPAYDKGPFIHFKEAVSKVINEQKVRSLFVYQFIFVLFSISFLTNWVVIFVPRLDNTPIQLGVLTVVFSMLISFFVWTWKYLEILKRLTIPYVFIGFSISQVLACSDVMVFRFLGGLGALFFFAGCQIGIRHAIFSSISSSKAGAILSLFSLQENFSGWVGLLSLAFFLKLYSVEVSWIASGACMVAAVGFYSFHRR